MKEFEQADMSLTIPDRCKACPRLAALTEVAESAITRREQVLDVMMSNALSQSVREAMDDTEMAEIALQTAGHRAVEMLEEVDEKLASVKRLANKAITACDDGPLKMRASKGERTYTATLCTSAAASLNETFIDNAHVTITQK